MKDEDFETVIDDILYYLWKRDYNSEGLKMAKNRIMYTIYKICENKDTYEKCIKILDEAKVLRKEMV